MTITADGRAADDQGWLAEHRYRAVLRVQQGVPIAQVAREVGASRQSVYSWMARYQAEGLTGLTDRSRRPHRSPTRMPAEVEALICELRRTYPRWGARRIAHEFVLRGMSPTPGRSSVYRVLVRHGLVEAQKQNHQRKYRRWQRDAPMQLWQMDIMGGVFLADGRECKLITGIDDHSRFVVIAKVVTEPSGRAVCAAFTEAMARYGVPLEVLTDNGKQFTGRFTKPMPAEVLFERICRENGITARRTRPRSPTTTGKIERLHQSLQDELLDVHGPFESLSALQAALDAWRQEYNTDRPHQSLDMAFPASRFAPAVSPLPLRVPPQLATASAQQAEQPEPPSAGLSAAGQEAPLVAVEADRVVPPSGNLWVGGQQVWLGPALADKKVTIWVDETSLHVLLDGARIKTLPSRLGVAELARLACAGARLAGPSPLLAGTGTAVEIERTVNATGLVGLAGAQVSVGYQLAGQRVTLRMDGTQMMVITSDGELARTMPCPVPAADRYRLRGARRATASPPPPSGPVTVQRRVSSRGGIMVATQKIQVGLIHAGKIVTVTAEDHSFRLEVDGQAAGVVPRTTTSEIHRYKAYAAHPRPGRR